MTRQLISTLVVATVAAWGGPSAFAQTAAPRYPPITPTGSAFGSVTYGDFLGSGFSVVLVVGDLTQGTGSVNVPPAAAKALADLRDFLPYKSYQLLDTAWLTGANRAVSHLRGIDGRDYDLSLEARQIGPTTVAVSQFRIVHSATGQQAQEASRLAEDIARARSAVQAQATDPRAVEEFDLQAARELQRRRSLSEKGLATPVSPVIDTSFNMRVGETVVVGTSRLQGDKALIVLLTAVARPK
jgi:hypothetical protein